MRPRDPKKVKEWAATFGGKAAAALVDTLTAEEIGRVAEALDAQAREIKAASAAVARATAELAAADKRLAAAQPEPAPAAAVKARFLTAINFMNGVSGAAGGGA